MSKSKRGTPDDFVPQPDAPFGLPKAFQIGGKLDVITPLNEIDEASTQLQVKAAATMRGQLGSIQGNVATLQQTLREGIQDKITPELDSLSRLIEPPIQKLSSGLGEIGEYAAGLGVQSPSIFPASEQSSLARENISIGGESHALRAVKPGEISSADELHQGLASGRIIERNTPLGERRLYWSGGGGRGGNPKIAGKNTQKSGIKSPPSTTRSIGAINQVNRLAGLIQGAGQSAAKLQQQWSNQSGQFNPADQFSVPPGIVDQYPGIPNLPNIIQNIPAIPGIFPGLPGQPPVAGQPPVLMPPVHPGPMCVLAISPHDQSTHIVAVDFTGRGVPKDWTVIAGPSAELCGLIPPNPVPPNIPPPNIPPPNIVPPNPAPVPGLVGSAPDATQRPNQTLRPPNGQHCPDVTDSCTYDIRKTEKGGFFGSNVVRTPTSEGPDNTSVSRVHPTAWQSFSSIEGNGTYTVPPGGKSRNNFDCKLAEGPDKACVEKVAESVSGQPASDGKSKSGEQYRQGLGESVSIQICEDYKINTLGNYQGEGIQLSQVLGLTDSNGDLIPYIKPDGTPVVLSGWLAAIHKGIYGFLDLVAALPIKLATNDTCQDIRLTPIYMMKGVYGFANRWLGFTPTAPAIRLDQAENLICTPLLPSADNAIEGKLANKITDAEYKCWIEATGIPKALWDKILESRKNKLSVEQLMTLWRRGDIDAGQLAERIRELGWLEDRAFEELEVLTRQYPGPQDIVRFMVRDVDDKDIVSTFGLSEQFGDKFQKRLQGWAKQAGIPDEVMLAYWQAHWEIPSPSQLYEMYHRLRKDPAFGNEGEFLEIVKEALIQQDIAPYWIDKFLAISFNPLTRVDVRRAFNIGVLNENAVEESYQFLGYSDENARTLTAFAVKDRKKNWAKHPIIKDASLGNLSPSEARAAANDLGLPPDFQDSMNGWIASAIERNRRKACIGAIRRRYLRGELDDIDRDAELSKVGVQDEQVTQIVAGWSCEKTVKSKTFAVGQLCKLHEQKIITIIEFQKSLHNLGYSPDDALKMLASCVKGIEVKNKKELEQNAKKQTAYAEKLRKAAIKEANDIDKNQAKIDRKMKAMRAARKHRSDAIVDSAEKLAKKTGESMVATLLQVKANVRRLQNERGFTEDEAIAQTQVAVDAVAKGELTDLWSLSFAAPLPLQDIV